MILQSIEIKLTKHLVVFSLNRIRKIQGVGVDLIELSEKTTK